MKSFVSGALFMGVVLVAYATYTGKDVVIRPFDQLMKERADQAAEEEAHHDFGEPLDEAE